MINDEYVSRVMQLTELMAVMEVSVNHIIFAQIIYCLLLNVRLVFFFCSRLPINQRDD